MFTPCQWTIISKFRCHARSSPFSEHNYRVGDSLRWDRKFLSSCHEFPPVLSSRKRQENTPKMRSFRDNSNCWIHFSDEAKKQCHWTPKYVHFKESKPNFQQMHQLWNICLIQQQVSSTKSGYLPDHFSRAFQILPQICDNYLLNDQKAHRKVRKSIFIQLPNSQEIFLESSYSGPNKFWFIAKFYEPICF